MSKLFTPIRLRGLTLPNRIMVAPMCQYSAQNGAASAWHLLHIGSLAMSGAGMFCIEATHVEPEGRITPGCLGLWDDVTEAALRPVMDAVRKYSKIAMAIQLAHAGRKAPSHVPVGVKVSATDWVPGGWDLEQTIEFSRELGRRGVDWVDASSGGLSPLQKIAAGPGYQVPFAQAIKEATGG